MIPHLILQQKGKHYLLIRYPDRIHLITVDRKLSAEAEERVLSGVFSNTVLDELGLSRETIRLQDLRGVAVSGPETGETVTLYIGKSKRTWQLSDDSTEADMNAIFENVERRIGRSGFNKIWKGETWKNIMPEIYTPERRRYHAMHTGNSGEYNGRAILTKEQVDDIRERHKNGERTEEIYKDYKNLVSQKYFSNIVCGYNWKA